MSRSATLLSILAYLEAQGITLTELVRFLLVSTPLNGSPHPLLCDFISNVKTILSSLYQHPVTSSATREWAHEMMCSVYSQQVSELSRLESGWHFSASFAAPEQVREFRVEEMASQMQRVEFPAFQQCKSNFALPEAWQTAELLLRLLLNVGNSG